MDPSTKTPTPALAGDLAERVATRTDDALQAVQAGIDALRDTVPAAASRVTARADDLTRRGLEGARQAAEGVHQRARDVAGFVADRVRRQPLRAALVAVAVGAAATLWMQRSRRPRG
jgi:ElaB/YqjD/DUF883 family membrane-anchored ribosome-binding protein